jgi:threonine dehydrogenase-like Zn-dependent dehydrogenase
MKALVLERNVPRFAASRVASLFGSGRGAGIGPLELFDVDAPEPPTDDWAHLRPLLSGICGSDLATLDGRSSRYFEDMVSFPFIPGHEVVGVLEAGGADHAGRVVEPGARVVVEPVLGCAPRHIDPPCPHCAGGHTGLCGNVAAGEIAPGLQIGFCADTGGGWSTAGLVAHRSQVHRLPESFTDEDGVVVEPTACAVHAVLSADIGSDALVAVIGAGTLGLLTVAALDRLVRPSAPLTVMAGAKHPCQRQLAESLGADVVVPPGQLARSVRHRSRSLVLAGRLTDGADVVFDCVGSSGSVSASLDIVRPRGQVVLVGMPGRVSIDLAPLWHRELTLTGSYAYGVERPPAAEPGRTFELAIGLVAEAGLGSLVSATYPLERYEEAIAHAGSAGRRGAVKVAFDLRKRRRAGR